MAISRAHTARRVSPTGAGLAAETRLTLLLLGIVVPYAVAVWSTLDSFGLSPAGVIRQYAVLVVKSWLILLPVMGAVYFTGLARHTSPPPLRDALQTMARHFSAESLLARLTPLVVLALLLGSYTGLKTVIPELHPFRFDRLFMTIDRAMFLGTDPWRITHAVFGGPLATWFLQKVYIAWFAVMWLSLAFVTWRTDLRRLRAHYMLAFVMTWIIVGSIGALSLSSAGPCYYGWAVTGPDVYAPLMERLRAISVDLQGMPLPLSLEALPMQTYLRRVVERGEIVLGGGISAMPSIHVAVAVLIALAGYAYRRWLGWVFAAVAVLVWIGSVHLAWHYAVDGPVAAGITLMIWRVAGRLVDRLDIAEAPNG